MVDLSLLQSVSYIAGAIGVCVAAIFYVLNLRISQRNQELTLKAQRQTLETRQAQLLMGLFQTYSSKEFQTDFEEMLYTWNWNDYEDFLSKYAIENNNVVENGKFGSLLQFYEGTGVYVKSGLIDPDLVYDLMMEGVIAFWDRFSTIIEGYRSKYNAPQIYLGIEYLYHEMKKVRDARGYPASTFVHSTP